MKVLFDEFDNDSVWFGNMY